MGEINRRKMEDRKEIIKIKEPISTGTKFPMNDASASHTPLKYKFLLRTVILPLQYKKAPKSETYLQLIWVL